MNLDLVIVGEPFKELTPTIPTGANVFIEPFINGYNEALNRGAEKGTSDYIGFCNNDIYFDKYAISYLLDALKVFDSVSPWCPLTHSDWWGYDKPTDYVKGYHIGKIIAGWCIFTKRKTWETIGGFDERLKFWASDNAYGEQLKRHRLTHALVPKADVYHLKSQTLNKLSPQKYKEYTRDQIHKFEKLYGKKLFS